MRNVNHQLIMTDLDDKNEEFFYSDTSRPVVPISTPYSRKKQEPFHRQSFQMLIFTYFQLLATVCTTLGCLLNGTAIAYTGPALPSLLNITGDPADGTDIWTENIVINAQEASWISESR